MSRVLALAAFGLLGATACSSSSSSSSNVSKETHYESVVQVVRRDVVNRDAEGKPDLVDMELEWDPCPGDQYQVIRGDKKFAACTEKYGVGDYVPVQVKHWWDARGYYRWDIEKFGECARKIEAGAPGSYEKSQECADRKNYGRVVGFRCDRKPKKALMQRCPWTQRE